MELSAGQRAIPDLSIDAQTLERVLLAAGIGDVVTYVTLSAAIARDVQREARHLLTTARRRALRDHRMVFEPVVDVGMKRLDDHGIVGLGAQYVGRVHRLSVRGSRKLVCVSDFEKLPNAEKVEHNVRLAQLGTMKHLTSARTAKRLSSSVQAPSNQLSTRECLEAMKPSL